MTHGLWWMRLSSRRLVGTGLVIALLGAAPLLLYSFLGTGVALPLWPAVLATIAVPIGFLLLGISLLKWVVGRLQGRP